MNRAINRRAKCLFAVAILILFGQPGYGQTDIVTLSRVKDFINAGLTHLVLSHDSINKNNADKNWLYIDTALQKNTLKTPVYYAAMHQLLRGTFDSVSKKFSSKVDLIDITRYTNLDEQTAMRIIFDTAFILLQQQYGKLIGPPAKDSIFSMLMQKALPEKKLLPAVIADTIQKSGSKKPAEPSYVPWYAKFQGFLFWLLACVLISVALFLYCLDQIRQLKIKLEEMEKMVMKVREEKDPLTTHSGPVTTVYTEFRSLVTLKIKELYDIIDHLNLRIVSLENERTPSPSLIEESVLVNDAKNNAHIFYMGLPLPGYFPFSARSLKKDALYKFTLADSETEAEFEVINDGIPIAEALKDLSKYFEPACAVENEPQGEVRVIITKAPGKAVFDGEKWAIKEKATILFI